MDGGGQKAERRSEEYREHERMRSPPVSPRICVGDPEAEANDIGVRQEGDDGPDHHRRRKGERSGAALVMEPCRCHSYRNVAEARHR
jgi:hypothetical protein